MPTFRLRAWQTQVLYDCNEYEVDAETIEEAAQKLQAIQDDVQNSSTSLNTEGDVRLIRYWRHPDGNVVTENWVRLLDPEEVVDGDRGVAEIDNERKHVRDLIGVAYE